MMAIRCMMLAVLLVAPAVAVSESSAVTPVEKVIQLIEAMKSDIEGEGRKEAASYNTFACFCKSATKTKSDSIVRGKDDVDSLSASISDKTAERIDKETKLADRKKKQESMSAELADTKAKHATATSEYEATNADLSKAVSSLEGAIDTLSAAQPASASLLQTVQHTLDLAEALKIGSPQKKLITAFLQQGAGVDPSDAGYKSHSTGILKVLDDLLKDFRAEKAEVDTEWGKADTNFKAKILDLTNEMGSNKRAMTQLKGNIETLFSQIAAARKSLIQTDSTLKEDQLYLKELTERCEIRAGDWDQRTQMRSEELAAITKALDIIKNQVAGAEGDRALIQISAKAPVAPRAEMQEGEDLMSLSFVQETAKTQAQNFLKRARGGLSTQARREKVLSHLQKEGQNLGSAILSSLAMKIAADPFAKVKELIQKLIERLVTEATEEASKKGFCDTELGKARSSRDSRHGGVTKLSAELQALETKEDQLNEEIDELTDDLAELSSMLAKQTEMRGEEKDENMATLSEAKGGLSAVSDALKVLKSFYKQAAKAGSLLQKKQSPIDEAGSQSKAGFKGNYAGNQQKSNAILGLLETIVSDFERTIKQTDEAENEAASGFVKLDRTTKADIAGKSKKKELDEEDLKETEANKEQAMADIQSEMNLLDDALKQLEELKPVCIDTGMSYEERVAKREQEMAALKVALCILDTDNVEAECGK